MSIKELKNRTETDCFLPKNKIGLKIGSTELGHIESLLQNTTPKKLHLINNWVGLEQQSLKLRIEKKIKGEIESRQVAIHDGDIPTIMDEFPINHFDWIYINSHSCYEYVNRILSLATKKIKSGGIVAGSNFKVSPNLHNTEIMRPVLELIQIKKAKMIAISNCKCPDYVLQINKNNIKKLIIQRP